MLYIPQIVQNCPKSDYFLREKSSVLTLYLVVETKSRTNGTDDIDGNIGIIGIMYLPGCPATEPTR